MAHWTDNAIRADFRSSDGPCLALPAVGKFKPTVHVGGATLHYFRDSFQFTRRRWWLFGEPLYEPTWLYR